MIRHQQFRHMLRKERVHNPKLNIVITGGTKGLGRYLTKEFRENGDQVYILSRSENCNIGKINDLVEVSKDILDVFENKIDIWINNAGLSGGFGSFKEMNYGEIHEIISTNLLGTCVSCNIAHEQMLKQRTGGAIFNLAGAGSDGRAIENYAVYGATKAAVVQFSKTLQKEWVKSPVDVHIISPGMMLTDLLLDGMPKEVFDMVRFICADPEIVAKELAPRIKHAYYKEENAYIRFLPRLF